MKIKHQLALLRELMQLRKNFRKYFRVVPATTPELVTEAFRVRHSVYCEDLGWEEVNDEGIERDEYDDHAMHCLLQSTDYGDYVGCARIVVPDFLKKDAPLPFQQSCLGTLYPDQPDLQAMENGTAAEISRLAVIKRYRRRHGEENKAVALSDDDLGSFKRPRFPYIPVGLYMGILDIASRNGLETLYFMTEPKLATHFAKLGVELTQIGEPVEHRGTRVPYVMGLQRQLDSMAFVVRPLFSEIREEIEQVYRSGESVKLNR
ncbi:MAG: PEP-CTERM/exosortase system-associated acyltransferase [Sedimenticola sp.]